MKERDQLYVDTLISHEENWVAVVGFLHLVGDDSMSGLFIDRGYELEPINVYQKAMAQQ